MNQELTALTQNYAPTFVPVKAVRALASDTVHMILDGPSIASDFSFAGGQFNMLYAFGIGEVPIALCGDPDHPSDVEHTVRAVGRVTEALTDVKEGDLIGVRGPFGNPWGVEEARGKNILVVAGGLGIAPIRPLIIELARNRQHYRDIRLVYGARSPDRLLFRNELEHICAANRIRISLTVDHADITWRGHVAPLTHVLAMDGIEDEDWAVFMCGPEIMMRFAARTCLDMTLGEDDIFISIERNMNCALGHCGRCQFGSKLVCRDGPIFCLSDISAPLFGREI